MKKTIITLAATVVLVACGTAAPTAEAASSKSANSTTAVKGAKPIELTAAQFKTQVADYTSSDWKFLGSKPAIIDFYATWCGPCKQLAPILAELAAQYNGEIIIYKVDVDKAPEVAAAFGIKAMPTLLFIPMGGLPQMQQGLMPKADLEKIINSDLLDK